MSAINGIPSLKKPVIFSYIDSSHDKLHIEREIQCIKKKVNKTTYIMFDDMHLVNSLKNNRLNDALKYKKTLKSTLQGLSNLEDEIINPLKVLGVLQNNISERLLESHYAENNQITSGKREVVLSLYLTDD